MVQDGTVKNSSQRDGKVRGTEKVVKSRATTSRNASGNRYRTGQGVGEDEVLKRLGVGMISV